MLSIFLHNSQVLTQSIEKICIRIVLLCFVFFLQLLETAMNFLNLTSLLLSYSLLLQKLLYFLQLFFFFHGNHFLDNIQVLIFGWGLLIFRDFFLNLFLSLDSKTKILSFYFLSLKFPQIFAENLILDPINRVIAKSFHYFIYD